MPRDAGNEISSYAERTRGTGLSTTWHYTYLFLLRGFGILLFFPLPFPLSSLNTHNRSGPGSTSQCAAPSLPSSPPTGTRRLTPARTPDHPHPGGPGGNASHPPLPPPYPASPLNGSTCQIPVKSQQGGWNLAFGREVQHLSSCSHIWGKSRLLGRSCLHPWFWSTTGQTILARNAAASRMCWMLCNWRQSHTFKLKI